MSKKLEMTFLTNTGKNATLRVIDPKDGLSKADAFNVMDALIAENVFVYGGGDLSQKVRARITSVENLV